MTDITGVWPKDGPRPHESDGERKVYDALKAGMPAGWTAWHSLKVRGPDGAEAEGDFVIAAPGHGMVVIEIKDGRISVRDGQWYQNGRLMKRRPRDQALRFAKILDSRLNDCRCRAPFAVMTIFPDTPFDNAPSQDDLRGAVFGEQSLPQLCEIIFRGIERIIPATFGPPSGPWIEELHRLWGETWLPRLSLGNRHELNEERRIRMDNTQRCLLDQTEKTRLALVYGMAGSGKTMLAREKAIHAMREGRKVQVLCFTDPLAAGLSAALNEHGVPVDTVRRYAASLLKKAGLPESDDKTSDFWDQVSLRAARGAIGAVERFPDLLIVDEAQDFSKGDWELVRVLSQKDDGVCNCWAFCDMTQAYWEDRGLPEWLKHGMVFDLENNYRCPPPIMALARLVAGEIPVMDGSAPLPMASTGTATEIDSIPEQTLDLIREGLESGLIRITETRNTAQIQAAVDAEVAALLKGGLEPGDIAVISLCGREVKDSITKSKMFAGKAVLPADNPKAGQRLVADTFLRFKGLERSAVIVTDMHQLAAQRNLAVRLFIAMTRAQDFLRLVVAPGDLNRLPALRVAAALRKTAN